MVSNGTTTPFAVTQEKDGAVTLQFQSITCMPAYAGYSFEVSCSVIFLIPGSDSVHRNSECKITHKTGKLRQWLVRSVPHLPSVLPNQPTRPQTFSDNPLNNNQRPLCLGRTQRMPPVALAPLGNLLQLTQILHLGGVEPLDKLSLNSPHLVLLVLLAVLLSSHSKVVYLVVVVQQLPLAILLTNLDSAHLVVSSLASYLKPLSNIVLGGTTGGFGTGTTSTFGNTQPNQPTQGAGLFGSTPAASATSAFSAFGAFMQCPSFHTLIGFQVTTQPSLRFLVQLLPLSLPRLMHLEVVLAQTNHSKELRSLGPTQAHPGLEIRNNQINHQEHPVSQSMSIP